MENASKALIMAGSVLIALMIIGALLLMFNNLTSYQDTNTQSEREAQIVEFNNQYETYNRNDVRGSDLYSLLNKVIDYNRRKSTEGTGTTDEGQYIAYEPMTIYYTFDNKQDMLIYDGTYGNQIFTNDYATFELTEKTTNKLDSHFKNILKTDYATEQGMISLASGISNLYGKESDKDKLSAISLWNKYITDSNKQITGTNIEKIQQYNEKINNETDVKKQIYAYYEYTQFKRAHFECIGTEYNQKTGRIIRMNFKFTGKFN